MQKKNIGNLVRRFIKARKLGFWFVGTSYSRMPRTVRLWGQLVPLRVPADPGLMCDIINVWLDDEYGLERLGRAPATILDVGANVGLFSLWAHNVFPTAKIQAYEPNPAVATFASQNLSPWGGELIVAGVGRDAARACLISDSDSSRGFSTQITQSGDIQIAGFEAAVQRMGGQVDLLKLDCEGAEWDIFECATPLQKVKLIRMEYHLTGSHCVQELQETAARLGFSMIHLHEKSGLGIAWFNRAQVASHAPIQN